MSLDSCIGQTVRAYLFKNNDAELRFEYQTLGSTIDFPVLLLEGDLELYATEVEITKATPGWAAYSLPDPFEIVFLEVMYDGVRRGAAYLGDLTCAAAPTTTSDPGEDPPIPLEPSPRVDEPCLPEEASGSPAQQGGAIPAWGVNFEYLDEANEKKSWTLALLPAMQSNTRYSGGTDVPGALPGLSFRTIPSIARHKVPGFQPVYQHMGIDSVTVTMVGCFTGADGVEGTFRPKFDNTNVVLLGSGSDDRKAIIRQLDSYKSFQDFYRLSVQQGRELTVELNLAGGGKFTPSADTLGCTGLRNTRGNPQFKALVKRMDTYYARSDRTWYTIDLEITDYKLISAQPINLLPPAEDPAEDPAEEPAPTSPGDSSGSTSGGDTDAGINISGYEGNYETLGGPEYLVKNLELRGIDISEDLYEYEVSQAISSIIKGSLSKPIRRDGGKLILEGSSFEPVVTPIECKDLPPEVLLTLPLKDSKGELKEVEYPCAILGRRGRFGFGRRNREARIVEITFPGGDPFYYVHEDDIITPEGSSPKGIAAFVLSAIGCIAASSAAVAASVTAVAAGFAGAPVSGGISLAAAIFIAVLSLGAAYLACNDFIQRYGEVQAAFSNPDNKKRESLAAVFAEQGEELTWLGISIWAIFDIFGGWLVRSLVKAFKAIRPFIRALRQPRSVEEATLLGRLGRNIGGFLPWLLDTIRFFRHPRLVDLFDDVPDSGAKLKRIVARVDDSSKTLLESTFFNNNPQATDPGSQKAYVDFILKEIEDLNIEVPDNDHIRQITDKYLKSLGINPTIPVTSSPTPVTPPPPPTTPPPVPPASPNPSPPTTPSTPPPTATAPSPPTTPPPTTPPPTATAPAPTTTPQPVPGNPISGAMPILTSEQVNRINNTFLLESGLEIWAFPDNKQVGNFIEDLRARRQPPNGFWEFVYLEGQQPTEGLLRVLRSSGFRVDVSEFPYGRSSLSQIIISPSAP